MAIIEFKAIKKSYWIDGEELQVLKRIDLSVEEGEFVAVLGSNGSGKTSAMSMAVITT